MALNSSIFLVLHQVQGPENLGAVARVMANFGIAELVLSDPQTDDWETAEQRAVHAEQILRTARRTHTLREALEPATYACGTTFRAEVGTRHALDPEEAAQRLLARAADGTVALILGGERRGLSDEELAECDDFVTIPTRPEQPSMNLAQAAAVLLYVLSRASAASVATSPTPDRAQPARLKTVQALEAAMKAALDAAGFSNPQAPDYVLRELVQSLRRGGPTQREAELWTAAFKQLGRSASMQRSVDDSTPPGSTRGPARGD